MKDVLAKVYRWKFSIANKKILATDYPMDSNRCYYQQVKLVGKLLLLPTNYVGWEVIAITNELSWLENINSKRFLMTDLATLPNCHSYQHTKLVGINQE